jgi:hypothetical protein
MLLFCCVMCFLRADKMAAATLSESMDFSQAVREHQRDIFTVCSTVLKLNVMIISFLHVY